VRRRGRARTRAPPPPHDTSHDIVFYGDVRTDLPNGVTVGSPPAKWLRLSERIDSFPHAADLAGGDFIFPLPAGPLPTLDQLRSMYGNYLETRPDSATLGTFAVPGNHEAIATGQPRFQQAWSEMTGRGQPNWYKVDIEGIHVVCLSSDEPRYVGRVPPREVRDLRRWLDGFGRDDWVVVMIHHPLFDPQPTDPWGPQGGYAGERDALARILSQGGVDLVLQGDIHNFRLHPQAIEVAGPDGARRYELPYVTCGQGGAPPYAVDDQGPLHPADKGRGGDVAGYILLRVTTGAGDHARAIGVDYVWTEGRDDWSSVTGWTTETLIDPLVQIPKAVAPVGAVGAARPESPAAP